MVLIKCPRCGQTAEAADGLSDSDLVCYWCQCRTLYADPESVRQRAEAQWQRVCFTILGALAGMFLVPLIGETGGIAGAAFAEGVAGAVLGVIVGLGLLAEAFAFEPTGYRFLAWYCVVAMAIGLAYGTAGGITGQFTDETGFGSIYIMSGIGGACLAGFLAYRLWPSLVLNRPE